MRITYDKNIMVSNGIEIVTWAAERQMEVSWMVKKQFDARHIRKILKNKTCLFLLKVNLWGDNTK